jgi:hypothetical protein
MSKMPSWGPFGLFGGRKTTYSPFSGAPNQIVMPSTSAPGSDPNLSDPVISAYSRQPLWFSSAVEPNIRAVVESSLYYPLQLSVLNTFDRLLGGPFNRFFTPPSGKHWIVLTMYATLSEQPLTPGFSYALSLGTDVINSATLIPSHSFITQNAALIGGRSQAIIAGVPYYEYGIPPVYVGNGYSLIYQLINSNPADISSYSLTYYELPENQPFGPLIGRIA